MKIIDWIKLKYFNRDMVIHVLRRKLKGKGLRISAVLTYACNFNCEYCCRYVDGKYPKSKIKNFDEWKYFLNELEALLKKDKIKINAIHITGGEPQLHPAFIELTEWILKKGWMVQVLTNLDHIPNLKPNKNLIFVCTYHPTQIRKDKFLLNYQILKYEGYNAVIKELGERKLGLKYTALDSINTESEVEKRLESLHIDPNFRMYTNCLADAKNNI